MMGSREPITMVKQGSVRSGDKNGSRRHVIGPGVSSADAVQNIFDYTFFFSSRRRHTRFDCDWSSDVCSSDLLAATTKACVLALFHNPRFYSTTSSTFLPTSSVKPFWDDLYAAHAELIINGHMREIGRASCRERV